MVLPKQVQDLTLANELNIDIKHVAPPPPPPPPPPEPHVSHVSHLSDTHNVMSQEKEPANLMMMTIPMTIMILWRWWW